MEWETFFDENPKPKNFEASKSKIQEFINHHATSDRPIVLVTSGGTTVPFEKNTVRFLDNFSAGTRGSASAEHFVAAGYAVVFLHRLTSLRPYIRHFSQTNFLDLLEEREGRVQVREEGKENVLRQLAAYERAKEENLLLEVSFTTLADYLWLLRASCERLAPLKRRAALYLAAAVADFYLPSSSLSEHKMQSSEGAPKLDLRLVPKMLSPLVKHWAPEAFVVSFKLETDPELLVPKAERALETYGHSLVVANLLDTRKREVVVVEGRGRNHRVEITGEEMEAGVEIEERIIRELKERHARYRKEN